MFFRLRLPSISCHSDTLSDVSSTSSISSSPSASDAPLGTQVPNRAPPGSSTPPPQHGSSRDLYSFAEPSSQLEHDVSLSASAADLSYEANSSLSQAETSLGGGSLVMSLPYPPARDPFGQQLWFFLALSILCFCYLFSYSHYIVQPQSLLKILLSTCHFSLLFRTFTFSFALYCFFYLSLYIVPSTSFTLFWFFFSLFSLFCFVCNLIFFFLDILFAFFVAPSPASIPQAFGVASEP